MIASKVKQDFKAFFQKILQNDRLLLLVFFFIILFVHFVINMLVKEQLNLVAFFSFLPKTYQQVDGLLHIQISKLPLIGWLWRGFIHQILQLNWTITLLAIHFFYLFLAGKFLELYRYLRTGEKKKRVLWRKLFKQIFMIALFEHLFVWQIAPHTPLLSRPPVMLSEEANFIVFIFVLTFVLLGILIAAKRVTKKPVFVHMISSFKYLLAIQFMVIFSYPLLFNLHPLNMSMEITSKHWYEERNRTQEQTKNQRNSSYPMKLRDGEQFMGYIRKGNTILYHSQPLEPEADAGSFELLDSSYARDIRHVYYSERGIDQADPLTFSWIKTDRCYGYSKDNQHVFWFEKIIPDADPNSFKVEGNCFARDSKQYYFQDTQVDRKYKDQCQSTKQDAKDNILQLFPSERETIIDTRPTIFGKIVASDKPLLDVKLVRERSVIDYEYKFFLRYTPGKLQNAEFYLDDKKVSDVFGFAQFPTVKCGDKGEIANKDNCLEKEKNTLPPILFFYKPSFPLPLGNHTLTVIVDGNSQNFTFYVTSKKSTDVSNTQFPCLPETLKYQGHVDFCSPGYYFSQEVIPVPVYDYSGKNIHYQPAFPFSTDTEGKYDPTKRIVQINIQGHVFDLFFPQSSLMFKEHEKNPNVYFPAENLYYKNGEKIKYEMGDSVKVDMIPVDSFQQYSLEKVIPFETSSSSSCDG